MNLFSTEFFRLKQEELEERYNRKQAIPIIKEVITESNIPTELELKWLSAIHEYRSGLYWESKNKRIEKLSKFSNTDILRGVLAVVLVSNQVQPIQSVATRVVMSIGIKDSIVDAIKTVSELLAVLAKVDMLDLIPPYAADTGMWQVKSRFSVDESIQRRLLALKFMPPMICEPNEITDLVDCSHLTTTKPLLLSGVDHKFKLNLDYINRMNKVALSLDTNMLLFKEEPSSKLDTPSKIEQFHLMRTTSIDVYEQMLELGNKFYLTWNYDDRGRSYSNGYHVNIQSTDYKKSLINLHT